MIDERYVKAMPIISSNYGHTDRACMHINACVLIFYHTIQWETKSKRTLTKKKKRDFQAKCLRPYFTE